MSRFTVMIHNGQTFGAETLNEARQAALAATKDGDLYGIEGQSGKGRFYLRRGSVAYEISARAAANEMGMRP